MTLDEKVDLIMPLLDDDSISGAKIEAYLTLAEKALLSHRYAHSSNKPTAVPEEYEYVQIQAVVNGLGISGAEGQTAHSENGISRTFKYSDMIDYIHRNVPAFVGVIV